MFTEGGGARLSVTEKRKDGVIAYKKPQAMLTAMISSVAFDPEAFLRLPDKDQAELLSKVAGLDTADLDEEYKEVFADRTVLNRELNHMGQATLPEGDKPVPVDIDALWGRREAVGAQVRKQDALRMEVDRREREMENEESYITANQQTIDYSEREIQAAESHIEQAGQAIGAAKEDIARRSEMIEHHKAETAAVQKRLDKFGDLAEQESELADAITLGQHVNRRVQEWESEEGVLDARQALGERINKATETLIGIKESRAKRIAECTMPVEGLSVEEGMVSYNGHPLSQTSHAQRLDVSLAVGMAQNPKLKVLRVENASLLDSRMLKVIEERCAEAGYQVWAEKVADEDTGVGLYIEDGVLATRQ